NRTGLNRGHRRVHAARLSGSGRKVFPPDGACGGKGRWYERAMTRRKPPRARIRPFRIADAADLCRIYPMFFVDNAMWYGNSRITVAETDGRAVGFVMWGPALEPAWLDRGVDRWAELHELHVLPDYQGRGIGTRVVLAVIRQASDSGHRVMALGP